MYIYAADNTKGIIIEFRKNLVNLESGIKINIIQNGKIPKLVKTNMFSKVKKSLNCASI